MNLLKILNNFCIFDGAVLCHKCRMHKILGILIQHHDFFLRCSRKVFLRQLKHEHQHKNSLAQVVK